MKKSDKPSEYFVGTILRAYDKADKPVTCSELWNHMVMECLRTHNGFKTMFEWDTSKAKSKNRVHTIGECIERGHVPGLRVDDRLNVTRKS